MLWIGLVLKFLLVEEILVPQNAPKLGGNVKKINVNICKERSYFCVFLIFPVLDGNKCDSYILCVIFLPVSFPKLFVIRQFFKSDLLKTTKQ